MPLFVPTFYGRGIKPGRARQAGMDKIFWLGNPFFVDSLKQCGWQNVASHYFHGAAVFGWEDIVRIAGFEPDVVVAADKSIAPFVLGMENFPCLTVFYAVDTHIHSWQPYYAQGFDACLVSLRDDLPQFKGRILDAQRVWWSPPYAKPGDLPNPAAQKIWDCAFIGSCDAATMPRRAKLLQALQTKVPGLEVHFGNYREDFPKARVVLNQSEHDDLNFRVFEAMGCGSALVTPKLGHGLDDLFENGVHMLEYEPDNAEDAAAKINYLLEHQDERQEMEQAAVAAIDASHREIHRARQFTGNIRALAAQGTSEIIARRRKNAKQICRQYLSLPYLLWAEQIDDANIQAAYVAAARGEFQRGN